MTTAATSTAGLAKAETASSIEAGYLSRLAADAAPLLALWVAAGLFYAAPWPAVYGLALLAVLILGCRRPSLALTLVPLFAPFAMAPKHVGSKEFPPAEIFLGIVCVAVAWELAGGRLDLRQRWGRIAASPYLLPAALLLMAGVLSTLFAADHTTALRALRWTIVEPLIYVSLLLVLLDDRYGWLLQLGALVCAGVAAGGISGVQFVTNQDLTYAAGSSIGRVKALYGSPDNLGLLLDRVLPVALGFLLIRRSNPGWRLVLSLVTLVLLTILTLTFSRGAWAAVAVSLLFILVLMFPWGWRAVAVVVVLAMGVLALKERAVVHTLTSGHSNTIHERTDIWQSSLAMIRDHPLLGVGPDNFIHYYAPRRQPYAGCVGLGYMKPEAWHEPCLSHPHDELLDFWLSTGIVGLAAFVWLQVVFWRESLNLWRLWRPTMLASVAAGLMAAMLAATVHGLVDNSYFLGDLALLFWLLMTSVAALRGASDDGVAL